MGTSKRERGFFLYLRAALKRPKRKPHRHSSAKQATRSAAKEVPAMAHKASQHTSQYHFLLISYKSHSNIPLTNSLLSILFLYSLGKKTEKSESRICHVQDQATSYCGRGSRGTEAVLHCSACPLVSTNAALLWCVEPSQAVAKPSQPLNV